MSYVLIPNSFSNFKEDENETDASKIKKELLENKQPETMIEWWKETIAVVKRLASSKVYIYQNLSTAFFLFGIMGFAQFIPKYMEYHFRINASTSGASGGIPKTFASVGENYYLLNQFLLTT